VSLYQLFHEMLHPPLNASDPRYISESQNTTILWKPKTVTAIRWDLLALVYRSVIG